MPHTLSLIVAMTPKRVIGCGNRIPWKLSTDLKRFKQITVGHSVVMGRKTYESIVRRLGHPLPERKNIVLSQNNLDAPGCIVAHSLDEALRYATGSEVFVIGGEDVYRAALPKADRLYVTMVFKEVEGDRFFPATAFETWAVVQSEYVPEEKGDECESTFTIYSRQKVPQPS